MRQRFGLWVLSGVALLAGCGDDDDGGSVDGGGDAGVARLCAPGAVNAALAAARAGDVVRLGSCRLTGPFTVPAGVHLQGEGVGATVLVAPVDGVAVTLLPGATAALPTLLSAMDIETDGRGAVVIKGAGQVGLSFVNVRLSRGVGIGIEQSTVAIDDVTIMGNLERDDAPFLPIVPDQTMHATHGLVGIGANLTLRRVAISKLAANGAVFTDSTVTWTGGSTCDNASVGLRAHGGTLMLSDVTACRTLQAGLNPVFGMLFTGGVTVTSTGLKAMDNERFGIAHVGSNGSHSDFIGMRNGDPAVWVEGATAFELKGTGTTLMGNKFNALVVRDSSNVTVRDAMIADTVLLQRGTIEATGTPMTTVTNGDGIQFLRVTASSIRDVRLVNNARTGLLFDVAGGANSDVQLMGSVMVSGPGNGALMQNASGMVAPGVGGWDNAVVRDSATMTRDVAVTARLGTVGIGIISPQILPAPLSSLLAVRL